LRRKIVVVIYQLTLTSNILNFHQSSIHPLSYFQGILTSHTIPIPTEKRIDISKSQSRNFVAADVPTLLKAATGSSVHSETSGTSQLIQNDLKQVKVTTEGFNSKYTKLPYDSILWMLISFSQYSLGFPFSMRFSIERNLIIKDEHLIILFKCSTNTHYKHLPTTTLSPPPPTLPLSNRF
jgi:hypothetical protein